MKKFYQVSSSHIRRLTWILTSKVTMLSLIIHWKKWVWVQNTVERIILNFWWQKCVASPFFFWMSHIEPTFHTKDCSFCGEIFSLLLSLYHQKLDCWSKKKNHGKNCPLSNTFFSPSSFSDLLKKKVDGTKNKEKSFLLIVFSLIKVCFGLN